MVVYTATKVLKEWKSLHHSEQSSRLAKKYAAKCGMRSMAEVRCAAWMEHNKIPFKYESEKWIYQYKPAKYKPDFICRGFAVEVKGKLTTEVRRKLLAILESNPTKKLYIVFERANNRIRGGSKTTYGEWATKNGIEWSETVPNPDWFERK